MRRLTVSLAFASFALLALSMPALAGGWAVTTLDALPGEVRAGETYRIGYTILQHGITPFSSSKTGILARSSAAGESLSFPARPDGARGHYVAEVRFPAAGQWSWEVQHEFGGQQLAPLTVVAAPSGSSVGAAARDARPAPHPSAGAAPAGLPGGGALRVVLPLAAALAAGLFGFQLASFRRRVGPSPAFPTRAAAEAPR